MEEIKDKIEIPQELDNIGRNTDGTFKTGHDKIPGSGRPKNTLKDYVRAKFSGMTDEEKEKWLEDNKIAGIDIWKMGEGNPKQDTEHSGEVKIKQSIYGGKSVQGLTGNEADIQPETKN